MQPSDVAFRVRMLAALMQLCTIVVSEVGLGRSSALFVDPHDMLFSWCWTSGSEVLAVECTCKHELCMIIQSGVRSTQYCKNVLRALQMSASSLVDDHADPCTEHLHVQ